MRSRLIWCRMPFPGGITSTFLNAFLVQSMKSKRSSLRRSSMARFLAKASGSKPPHSTASEWSTTSCVGTTGLTSAGSPPLQRDGVAQAGQVDQRGLAQDVVADHARREPREIEVALAFDELPQRSVQGRRVAAAHEVFGQHARGVGQRGVGAWLRWRRRRRACRSSRAAVPGKGLRCKVFIGVSLRAHYLRSLIGTNFRSSGPT